ITLKGGFTRPRIESENGDLLPSDYTWSFTTGPAPAPPPITTHKIWPSDPTPQNPIGSSSTPTEVGLKFRSGAAGFITGVRFYKGNATNGGPHVGHLWVPNETPPNTGMLLGSATFINETASGWQEARFPAPIPIAANTTYVVSYFARMGHYAVDNG